MKEVFKYAKDVRPGDVDSRGRRVASAHAVIAFDDGSTETHASDSVVMIVDSRGSWGNGSMLTHLCRAELSPLPGSEAHAALERLKRLQQMVEAAATCYYWRSVAI